MNMEPAAAGGAPPPKSFVHMCFAPAIPRGRTRVDTGVPKRPGSSGKG